MMMKTVLIIKIILFVHVIKIYTKVSTSSSLGKNYYPIQIHDIMRNSKKCRCVFIVYNNFTFSNFSNRNKKSPYFPYKLNL